MERKSKSTFRAFIRYRSSALTVWPHTLQKSPEKTIRYDANTWHKRKLREKVRNRATVPMLSALCSGPPFRRLIPHFTQRRKQQQLRENLRRYLQQCLKPGVSYKCQTSTCRRTRFCLFRTCPTTRPKNPWKRCSDRTRDVATSALAMACVANTHSCPVDTPILPKYVRFQDAKTLPSSSLWTTFHLVPHVMPCTTRSTARVITLSSSRSLSPNWAKLPRSIVY